MVPRVLGSICEVGLRSVGLPRWWRCNVRVDDTAGLKERREGGGGVGAAYRLIQGLIAKSVGMKVIIVGCLNMKAYMKDMQL